jgi:hypothetical protein
VTWPHWPSEFILEFLYGVGAVGGVGVGVEIPHAVVVFAVHLSAVACAEEAEGGMAEVIVHFEAGVDGVVGAVVILCGVGFLVYEADFGVYCPYIGAFAALAVTIDAGGEGCVDAAHFVNELGGLFGEEEVAAVLNESLEGADGGFIVFGGEVVQAQAATVDMNPDHIYFRCIDFFGFAGGDNSTVGID